MMGAMLLTSCTGTTTNENEANKVEQNSSETEENKDMEATTNPTSQDVTEENNENGSTAQEEENSTDKASEQLKLICENSDMWWGLDDRDDWQYTVTDLDQNGRLEVIAAYMAGSGNYTTINIYEVSEDGSALNHCTDSLQEGESAPELIVDSTKVYASGDKYQYVVNDVIDMGKEIYESTQAFSLQNGVMQYESLASKNTILNDDMEEESVTYMDADMNEISESEYQSLCTSISAEREYEQKFQWFDGASEELENAVKSSYSAFAGE